MVLSQSTESLKVYQDGVQLIGSSETMLDGDGCTFSHLYKVNCTHILSQDI